MQPVTSSCGDGFHRRTVVGRMDGTSVARLPLDVAVSILRRGGLVALPTETVYGLAADAENEAAVRRIFVQKGRPATHPLIVHLASAKSLEGWARKMSAAAWELAAAFWPGPLTLVLPRGPRVDDVVSGGAPTVAVRVPAHPLALAILSEFGGGLAMPSANRFGRLSPTTARAVEEELGMGVDLIVDGGPCRVGVESTIVDCSGTSPAILRHGGIPREALEAVLGIRVPFRDGGDVRAPGTLAAHYAPSAAVEIVKAAAARSRLATLRGHGLRCAWIVDFRCADCEPDTFAMPDDPAGYARALYETLREIDRRGFDVAIVSLPNAAGIGVAIADRVTRAAAAHGHVMQ